MKKLFLVLAVAGFAFASCGKKAATPAERPCEEAVEVVECEDGFIIDEEVIEFDGEECEEKEAE
jgi:hypothetical protein